MAVVVVRDTTTSQPSISAGAPREPREPSQRVLAKPACPGRAVLKKYPRDAPPHEIVYMYL